jgi:hypothetical protein
VRRLPPVDPAPDDSLRVLDRDPTLAALDEDDRHDHAEHEGEEEALVSRLISPILNFSNVFMMFWGVLRRCRS